MTKEHAITMLRRHGLDTTIDELLENNIYGIELSTQVNFDYFKSLIEAISDGEYTIKLSGIKPTLGACVVDIVKNDEYYPEYWR